MLGQPVFSCAAGTHLPLLSVFLSLTLCFKARSLSESANYDNYIDISLRVNSTFSSDGIPIINFQSNRDFRTYIYYMLLEDLINSLFSKGTSDECPRKQGCLGRSPFCILTRSLWVSMYCIRFLPDQYSCQQQKIRRKNGLHIT